MNQNSTQLNLIKYIYNETDDIENIIIENEILNDEKVCEEYASLSSTKSLLDKDKLQPSKDVLNTIFSYAKALDVIHLKESKTDVILN